MDNLSNSEKFLPIGSIVLLKNGTKRVMITGFCLIPNNEQVIYDYSGCIYPEGMLTSSKTFLFNHEQIEKVFHIGYIDDEEKEFKKKLNDVLKEREQQKKEDLTKEVLD